MTRVYLKSNGALVLSEAVSCDGFDCERPIRVQTHIHSDHMCDFETSKAHQTILVSKDTRDLLIAIYNADLRYRNNLRVLPEGQAFEVDRERIEFHPSDHMLGSVQVCVTDRNGYRVGYSSDFFWPMAAPMQVDELVVDSTYGDPARQRGYNQHHADDQLLKIAAETLGSGRPFAFIGHNGRLQLALHMIAPLIQVPVIATKKAHRVANVYRQSGYSMPEPLLSDSPEAIAILRKREPCVAMVSLSERRAAPWVDRFVKISLSAYMSRRDTAVTRYHNGDVCIAMTDHADFQGTLEYIEATGARKVWTDPRTGNAEALAEAVQELLGVDAAPIPEVHTFGWG
jgi:putative mRNA 3-end processing factor